MSNLPQPYLFLLDVMSNFSFSTIPAGRPISGTTPPAAKRLANSNAIQAAHIAEAIKGIVLSLCYFGIAQTGIALHFGGAIFAVVAALCLPQWRPYILLMVLSVQDAPGQVMPFDYAAVAAISCLTFLSKAFFDPQVVFTDDSRQFRTIVFCAAAVVIYGLISSWVYSYFGFYKQSPTKHFAVVGGLMLVMILMGYLTHQAIFHDPFGVTRLRVVIACILIHIFLIVGLQVKYGPMFGASAKGRDEIKQQDQSINPGERGLARLHGPFLSSNSLVSVPLLFMLILLRTRRSRTIPAAFIAAFFVVGMATSVAGGARTMFVFYLAATAAMTWTRSPGKTLGAAMLMAPLIFLVEIPWDDVLVIMRLNNLQSLGVRGRLWQVSLDNMHLQEWLFGFGLTHFPGLFKAKLGYSASDPHSWILSVAGMFGSFGLLFYFFLAVRLLQRSFAADRVGQASAACLLLFLMGRELGNVQYVFNNHPICCLYWISIGFVFTAPKTSWEPTRNNRRN